MSNRTFRLKTYSLILKVCNLLSKFLLLFVITKYSDSSTVANYALYLTTLTLASTTMGFEVYAYTSRKLLTSNDDKNLLINKHFSLLACICIIVLPIVSIVYGYSISEFALFAIIFPFHLFLDYFSLEIGRLFVALGSPFYSVCLNFLRSSLWIVPLVLVILCDLYDGDILSLIIKVWLAGSLFSFVMAVVFLYKVEIVRSVNFNFDFSWVKRAIQVSLLIFIASLISRGVVLGDRYLVNVMVSNEYFAIYAFFATISFAVVGLLETAVSIWKYPTVLTAIKNDDKHALYYAIKDFFKESLIIGFLFITITLLLIKFVVNTYLSDIYSENIEILFIMMVGVYFYLISMPFHYAIYGSGEDKKIVIINSIGFFIMLTSGVLLIHFFSLLGAAYMFLLSLFSISFSRVYIFIDLDFFKGLKSVK